MNELTSYEKCLVFSSYPGCILFINDTLHPVQDKVEGIDFVNSKVIAERVNWEPSSLTLVLKECKDLWKEEHLCKEIVLLTCPAEISDFNLNKVKIGTKGESYFTYIYEENEIWFWFDSPSGDLISIESRETERVLDLNNFTQISFLLKRNFYAVPLYFGFNHWANGKTAIELSVAKTIETIRDGK